MLESSKLNISYSNSTVYEPTSVKMNMLLIAAAFGLCTVGIAFPFTRESVLWLLSENRPVEILTFALLLVAGVIGLRFVFHLNGSGGNKFFSGFYLLFSLGLLFTAMEEIAWGQQFLKFETPETLREINAQGETTLHNIKGMQGNTEYLRLIYGISGMIGVLMFSRGFWEKIAPPFFLLPWFGAIALHSVIDVYNDMVPIHKEFDALISRKSELVELLIAASALIYISVNKRKLQESLSRSERFI